jgi:predicted metalloprotease
MRIENERESENVEDRRSLGGRVAIGGGLGGLVLVVVFTLLGGDPSQLGGLLGGGGGGDPGAAQGPLQTTPEEEKLVHFVKKVLASTEDVWGDEFRKMGRTYVQPKLVLFRGHTDSACGSASSAMGPFYCPGDQKLYIDLAFYDELRNRFQAPGDFAQAYVIAHEVGHHVQNLLGTSEKVHRLEQQGGKTQANALSVRLELQADFYAGVWANHADRSQRILEAGDLETAVRAATAIGDDALQRAATGRVVPDTFTHGTSAQRVAWLTYGFRTGDVSKGNTFDDAVFQSVGAR